MPADVPPELQEAYQASAERVATNSRGTLPFGAKMQTVSEAGRGVNPFRAHIDYLDQQIVLAGTGGKLTMLTESGSGTLAGAAHSDTFDEIALSEAFDISEIFQKQHDKLIINEQFPGQPILAYFEIAAKEQEDTGDIITNILDLANAGYEVDKAQIEELTGLKITLRAPVSKTADRAAAGNNTIGGSGAPPAQPGGSFGNRDRRSRVNRAWRWLRNRAGKTKQAATQDDLLSKASLQLTPVQLDQMKALANRYKNEVLNGDPATLKNRSNVFMERTLPEMLEKMALDPSKEKLITDACAAAYFNGALNN
jgi:hypothetical protein